MWECAMSKFHEIRRPKSGGFVSFSPKGVHLSLHCVHSCGFCVVRTKNVRNFVHRVQGFSPIRRCWLPGGRLAALHGRNLGCGCVTLPVLPGKMAVTIDAALQAAVFPHGRSLWVKKQLYSRRDYDIKKSETKSRCGQRCGIAGSLPVRKENQHMKFHT